MKFEAITIKDIAKALGLSTSTVSRALRDSYEISPETKKLVLEYAEKNNYHPNPIALSLKERRSRSIGVIVCEIANSFFSQVINGIESIAYNHGYNVIIAQSRESFDREMLNLQYLTSRSIGPDQDCLPEPWRGETADRRSAIAPEGAPSSFGSLFLAQAEGIQRSCVRTRRSSQPL